MGMSDIVPIILYSLHIVAINTIKDTGHKESIDGPDVAWEPKRLP